MYESLMNLWSHIDPDYVFQIISYFIDLWKTRRNVKGDRKGRIKGKVGPTRMMKSDITFDYLASSQLREEAPKNWSPAN